MDYRIEQRRGQSPEMRQTQRLMATHEMQKALLWLQLPQVELQVEIEQELEENPILDLEEELTKEESLALNEEEEIAPSKEDEPLDFDADDFSQLKDLDDSFSDLFQEPASYKKTREEEKIDTFRESLIQEIPSLADVLTKEATETFEDENHLYAARIIIGYLDERGFLTTPLKEIQKAFSIPINTLEAVLEEIKKFDPPGVGASTLQESLELQLERKGKRDSAAFLIIHRYFKELLGNKIPLIARELSLSAEEIMTTIDKEISCLDIHPGTRFSKNPTAYVSADLTIVDKDGTLVAEVNQERLPALRLNRSYLKMIDNPSISNEEKLFLRTKIKSAKWLIKTLLHRKSTLEQIGDAIIRLQKPFFLSKSGQLKPMTMRRIAEELNLHESTIARAVSNKYVDCPKGLLPLRSFFTSDFSTSHGESVSSKTVKDVMVELIRKEDKQNPLSDEKIAEIIHAKGITCARRTVAKFRALLGIGNTRQRRKWSS